MCFCYTQKMHTTACQLLWQYTCVHVCSSLSVTSQGLMKNVRRDTFDEDSLKKEEKREDDESTPLLLGADRYCMEYV